MRSLTAFARRWGRDSEAPAYLKAVDAWRTAWKPPDNRVRVVLLAESHVAEMDGDARVRVTVPNGIRPPVELPSRYVRLVYCLGYGENGVCSPPADRNDRGTIQYWDMFGALAYGYSLQARQPRKAETPGEIGLHTRIGWKLATLALLRERGHWLLDVSPWPCTCPAADATRRTRVCSVTPSTSSLNRS